MGYSFGWNSKKEIVEYLTRPFGDVEKSTTLAHSCAGNILWSVIERVNSETGNKERFIACTILKTGGSWDDWGYKGLDESMHPYYYSCPLKYLDLAPVANAEWRAKVIEYWQGRKDARAKNATLIAGSKITLPEGWTVRNFTLKARVKNTWTAYGSDGRLYRLPLKAIQHATVTP